MLYDQVDYAGLAGSFGFDAKGVYRGVENLMLFVHNHTKTGENFRLRQFSMDGLFSTFSVEGHKILKGKRANFTQT